jgi:hypothetical protein
MKPKQIIEACLDKSTSSSKAAHHGGRGGRRRKPEYHFENLEHEKNGGSIFHAGFRVTTNFKSCSLRRLVVVTFEKYNYKIKINT